MRKWLGRQQETEQNGQNWKRRQREREESEWMLEAEGEAEVPEIITVSDAVEGIFVDLDGKSRCEREQVEANLSRRGREILNEGVSRRKVIRVESEETQEYVKEAKSMHGV